MYDGGESRELGSVVAMVAVLAEKNEERKVGSCCRVVTLLRAYNPITGASFVSMP